MFRCKLGFDEIDGQCLDKNECLGSVCGVNDKCINTIGSYKCESNNQNSNCIDANCAPDAECIIFRIHTTDH